MSLDLTRAEVADRVAKCKKRPTARQLILLTVFALLLATVFGGWMFPDPISCYPSCTV